jgi:hypothetical protein
MRKFRDYADGTNAEFIRDCWYDIDENDLIGLKNEGFYYGNIQGDIYYGKNGFARGALLCRLEHKALPDMVLLISDNPSGDDEAETFIKDIFVKETL